MDQKIEMENIRRDIKALKDKKRYIEDEICEQVIRKSRKSVFVIVLKMFIYLTIIYLIFYRFTPDAINYNLEKNRKERLEKLADNPKELEKMIIDIVGEDKIESIEIKLKDNR